MDMNEVLDSKGVWNQSWMVKGSPDADNKMTIKLGGQKLKECLIMFPVGEDTKGQGEIIGLAVIEHDGVSSFILRGFKGLQSCIKKFLNDRRPIITCDRGEDWRFIAEDPRDWVIFDPAAWLLDNDMEGFGEEGANT